MATLIEQELDEAGMDTILLTYHGQHGADVGWNAAVGGKEFTAKDLERAIVGALRADDPVVEPPPEEEPPADEAPTRRTRKSSSS